LLSLRSEFQISKTFYSSAFALFFEARLAAFFSPTALAAASDLSEASVLGAARLALGAAAAPPRFRPLLSANLAGFASAVAPRLPFASASGFASFESRIVT
jgi:hypothetical protein